MANDVNLPEPSRNAAGLNLTPGSADDGWDAPPPIDLPGGTRIQLYKDGEGLAAAYRAIENARHRVLAETYILANDDTGKAFCDLLAKRAAEGVKVFLIYDSVGSLFTDRDWLEPIRAAGGFVREFHPVRFWECKRSWRPWNRDHRKLLFVDDDIAGIGGLNIGTRYAGSWVANFASFNPDTLWRDTSIGIQGPGARQFARCFAKTWRYLGGVGNVRDTLHVSHLHLPASEKGKRVGKPTRPDRVDRQPAGYPEDLLTEGVDLGLLASAPTLSSPLRPMLHKAVRDARRTILLTMAYFAPDDTLIDLLCAASSRGVVVKLMLPAKSDSKILVIAAQSFYEKLMDAGAEIYEREGAMLHAKHLVVDGRITIIGSTNLDFRSIEVNLESSAVVRSEALGAQMEKLFAHDVDHAERIDPDTWRERRYLDRIVQWTVSRVRYLL